MDQGTNQRIEQYIASVAENFPGLVGAYLFGSYSTGNFKADSDIDIAFVMHDLSDQERFGMQVELMMLASQFDSRIEPHPISKQDLTSSINPFAAEIRQTGIEFQLKAL